MSNNKKIIYDIREQLAKEFNIMVELRRLNKYNEYEITIFDKNRYHSKEFASFVFELKKKLWDNNIYGVYFTLSIPQKSIPQKLIVQENLDTCIQHKYKTHEYKTNIPIKQDTYKKGENEWISLAA
ncbi:hypothetical protein [Treponema phagedenis]|uniref:Uncharacterized protein n=1 Tax=Treponema phagedenis TaxID=162 RepID=A0AAE6IU84_TREPH|nr:hypothetical protein [Treponema phagedenis]NVP22660.1 hypothetical protein [Treponema phagedenis]QEJ94684.1 hypothetical protein FUT79_05335 [Treponema phagedenis]QEJ95219.1 hypothetical protein FUT79_08410 [Treponema phagedenis]QEJ97362.1 hypothetical protein FUT82_04705 [Treponema phagedenis]QEJ98629.1 hypothetical protein FUT82_11880 [Treponema phagedenis]